MKYVKTYEQLTDFHQMGEAKYYVTSSDGKYALMNLSDSYIDGEREEIFDGEQRNHYCMLVEINDESEDFILGNKHFEYMSWKNANEMINERKLSNSPIPTYIMELLKNKHSEGRSNQVKSNYFRLVLKGRIRMGKETPIDVSKMDFKIVEYNIGMVKKTKLNI
jgi:hypothetical protein